MKSLFPQTGRRYFVYMRTGNGVTRRETDIPPRIRNSRFCRNHLRSLATYEDPCESDWAHGRFERLVRADKFMESRFEALLSRNPEGGMEVAI